MSWKATAFVKKLHTSTTGIAISRPEKFLLLMMADYHNEEWGYASPSVQTLAKDCLYEPRQVMRILQQLEDNGFIEVTRRTNAANRYVITGLSANDKMSPPVLSTNDILRSKTPKMSPEPLLALSSSSKSISRKPRLAITNLESYTVTASAIYEAYPRHLDREAAIKSIDKAAKKIAMRDGSDGYTWLLSAVGVFAASVKVKTTPKQFIPYPATWFNRGGYDDDRSEWTAAYSNGNGYSPPVVAVRNGNHLIQEIHGDPDIRRERGEDSVGDDSGLFNAAADRPATPKA